MQHTGDGKAAKQRYENNKAERYYRSRSQSVSNFS